MFKEIKTVIDDRLFVEYEPEKKEEETKTAGGIILTGTTANRMAKLPFKVARVLKAGNGMVDIYGKLIPMTIHEGDRVIIEAAGGFFRFTVGTRNFAILNEKQVIAVVTEEFRIEPNKELAAGGQCDPGMDLSQM